MTLKAIDCQGFAGGFTLGAVQAGFELVGKRELPGGFGVPSVEANRHLLPGNWETQVGEWHEWEPKDGVPYIFGNPPCSGFSLLSHKDFRGPDSKINSCMWAFTRYAARNPDVQVVAFESVQGAFKQGRELMQALRDELDALTGDSWTIYHVLHNGINHGGPAIRRRYFFVAARIPFGLEPEVPERVPVLRDVISDLQGLETDRLGEQPYSHDHAPTWWSRDKRRKDGMVDGHITLSNPSARRVSQLAAEGEWGYGETLSTVAKRYYRKHGRLPSEFPNHLLDKWVTKEWALGFYQACRWNPDKAGRVTTGAAMQMVLHPFEDRTLTLREVYRLQGFPDTWLLEPAVNAASLRAASLWPGKGIPVQAGEYISRNVYEAIIGNPGSWTGDSIGDREFVLDSTNFYKIGYSEKTGEVGVDTRSKELRKKMDEVFAGAARREVA